MVSSAGASSAAPARVAASIAARESAISCVGAANLGGACHQRERYERRQQCRQAHHARHLRAGRRGSVREREREGMNALCIGSFFRVVIGRVGRCVQAWGAIPCERRCCGAQTPMGAAPPKTDLGGGTHNRVDVRNPPSTEGHHMNWDTIQGNWKQLTGRAKQQWGKLTDDDLTRGGWSSRPAGWKDPGALRHCQGRSRGTALGVGEKRRRLVAEHQDRRRARTAAQALMV